MTGPEQHAATERIERLTRRLRSDIRKVPVDEREGGLRDLDELVALAGTTLAVANNALADEGRRRAAAEARADELQRALDNADYLLSQAGREREQARREADQLQQKLDRLANVESTWELLQQNDRQRSALEEIAGTDFDEPSDFSELGRIARAALAGVQADNKDSA